MARIKKRGLDYFPINTDFIHDRAVRRLMKCEGDAALFEQYGILTFSELTTYALIRKATSEPSAERSGRDSPHWVAATGKSSFRDAFC